MIDMHGKFNQKNSFEYQNYLFIGTLKEGDYLLQAGVYSLVGIDISIALVLIERAYDEGRNVDLISNLFIHLFLRYILFQTVSFVAARQQKPDRPKLVISTVMNKKEADNKADDQELTVRTSTENKTNKQEQKMNDNDFKRATENRM